MILQPLIISLFDMVRGGVILIAFGSKSNQNRINPSSLHFKTTLFVTSAEVVIAASISPRPRISEIN